MTHPGPPRIAPGDRKQIGLFAYGFTAAAGLVMRSNPPRLFRTMARNPKLFRGWLRFAGRLMPGGTLPRRDTELLILRVAHLRDCAYEFDHHVRLGKRAGVTAADVTRVQDGPEAPGWTAREAVLLRAADALVASKGLDDELWHALSGELAEPQAIEFVLLVTHYDMLATFLLTLRIEPDTHR